MSWIFWAMWLLAIAAIAGFVITRALAGAPYGSQAPRWLEDLAPIAMLAGAAIVVIAHAIIGFIYLGNLAFS